RVWPSARSSACTASSSASPAHTSAPCYAGAARRGPRRRMPGSPRYDLVVFDLDGTLIDSERGIVLSVRHALAQAGIQESDPQRLRGFIGPPLLHSFQARYGLDDEAAWRAVEA